MLADTFRPRVASDRVLFFRPTLRAAAGLHVKSIETLRKLKPQVMGSMGRMPELTLTEHELATLQRWAGQKTLARRCRIVLACAQGRSNKEVAADLGVHPATVGKWRSRFIRRGLAGVGGLMSGEDGPAQEETRGS
jgi:DNA-binding CsgD family transcriptional regulator